MVVIFSTETVSIMKAVYHKPNMRILHFVTGGFSGATNVAIDLVRAHQNMDGVETALVLRRKRTSTPERLQRLQQQGIPYFLVSGTMHMVTIYQLMRLCRQWQPDILVVHGFPEHIIGRWAGLFAKVPHMVQIEHNSRERYTLWKRWQSRFLSRYTDCVVGVSAGVAEVLQAQALHAPVMAIANGIDGWKFMRSGGTALAERPRDVIMVGRFAKSKDQATVVKALALLRVRGINTNLTLVGSGSAMRRSKIMALVSQQQLDTQVRLIPHSFEVDKLLGEHKIFVMASFYEGLNLSVLEAMAARCLVVGSRTIGVSELIEDGVNGFDFPMADEHKLADILQTVLSDIASCQGLADAAQQQVLQRYSKDNVSSEYMHLFQSLMTQQKLLR